MGGNDPALRALLHRARSSRKLEVGDRRFSMRGHISKTKRHAMLTAKSATAIAVRDHAIKRLLGQLFELCPHLTKADLPIARRFCEVEIIVTLAFAELKQREEAGLFVEKNKNLLDTYRRFAQTQTQLANALGLTPASRAMLRLGKNDSPDDLVAQFASDQKRIDN